MNIPWGFQGLQEMINYHPIFVHFPIVFFFTAIAFYFLAAIFRKEYFLIMGKTMLLLGALSTIPAASTGWQAANSVPHGGESHQILVAHQYLGFAIAGLSLLLSGWVLISKTGIPKAKLFFLAALLLLGALVGQQADLGGRLVFLHGVGVGKKSMIQPAAGHKTHEHEHGHHPHQH
ncbi:MAG: DUF2231 domain-containing protein [Candidatus Omnitrophica bacterium]|nr:DUF2231 domain-containing protein [Candidatus Omnitrophota bacterium]